MTCRHTDPPWLVVARTHIRQRETLAPNDSHWIRLIWERFNAKWLLGKPYCGGALAYWMDSCQVAFPKTYYRARDWLDWGMTLADPCVGAVVVFERTGGGHVALVEGVTATGDLACLGANQSDSVNIAPFSRKRVLGYRWPTEYADLLRPTHLPLIDTTAPRSTNEV